MNRWAILLRGVMPSGRNRVPMADLRVALDRAGLEDVRTYIQSGNVVARSALARGALEDLVRQAIVRDIGADIAVIARTSAEMRDVLERNPYPLEARERTYFTLFAQPPAPELAARFLDQDFTPDHLTLTGHALYTCYATRLSDSKFHNNVFERQLKVTATTRNFNTLTRLVEMTG